MLVPKHMYIVLIFSETLNMEVNVDGVYFGDSSVYQCTYANFSKLSISMTFSNSENGETKKILVMKKNIIDLKASEGDAFPVISLKLKDKECQKIKELLKLEEKGVNFNSRSKNMKEVRMHIFYNFTSFAVPKFLASNYIEQHNFMSSEEFVQFHED